MALRLPGYYLSFMMHDELELYFENFILCCIVTSQCNDHDHLLFVTSQCNDRDHILFINLTF